MLLNYFLYTIVCSQKYFRTHTMENSEYLDDEEQEAPEQSTLNKVGMFFLELIKVVVLAGITIVLIRYFLFKPFYVKGQSMEPNFFEKDYLIIDEITYRFREPLRGEVIVFQAPGIEDHYLKRVIGLPGERVKVEGEKIIIYNDLHPQGMVMEELYLDEQTPGSITITLQENEYFVLGDNRDASYDSRRFGAIKKDTITGRVWFRGWPFTRISSFTTPEYNF